MLAACGNSSASSQKEALSVQESANDKEYAEYTGYQFSGSDPWGGTLTITIKSITDGKMDRTFIDSFENHTLYQAQNETVLKNAAAYFDIQGEDVEQKDVSFAYRGTMELKDGKITVTFDSGSVTSASPEGGSSYRFAESLSDSGLSHQVVLDKAVNGPYVRYIVQEGDSIHSIAKEHGISTKQLAILNQVVITETAKAHGLVFDDAAEYAKYLFPGEELLVPNS